MWVQALVTRNSKVPWKTVRNRLSRSRMTATRVEKKKPKKKKDRTWSKLLQTLIGRISARHQK